MFGKLYDGVWQYKYLFTQSKRFCSHSLITATSLLAISTTALAACPEANSDRVDYQSSQERTVLETSDGKHYGWWWDMHAQPITFQRTTYGVVIKCSKTLTVYTHLDSIEEVSLNGTAADSYTKLIFWAIPMNVMLKVRQ